MKSSKTCEKVDIQKWKLFKVGDIFPKTIKPEVYHVLQLIQDDNGIPYVVRSKFNNGIKYRIKKPTGKINPQTLYLLVRKMRLFSINKKSGFLAGIEKFKVLEKLNRKIKDGGIVCLIDSVYPISEQHSLIPVGLI